MKKVLKIVGIVLLSIIGIYTIFVVEESIRLSNNVDAKPVIVIFKTDLDSPSLNIIDVDVGDLEPQVACPHNVDNVACVSEVDVEIDQVFLGSCTNGIP